MGYFKVQVEGSASRVGTGTSAPYDIVIRVLDPGKQYRLGDLSVVNVTGFPTHQSIAVFPIRRGDIFSREKIAKGLGELRVLYGSQGYINYTGLPNTRVDDENAIINLTIDVDEGKQFRWGNLHLEGMRDQDADLVLQAWEELRGDVYSSDHQKLSEFLGRFFFPLRKGTSIADCARTSVDERTGTIDVYLSLILNPDLLQEAAKIGALPRVT